MSKKRYVVDNRKPSIFSKISQAAVVVGSIATATVITTPAFGFLDMAPQSPLLAQGGSLPTSNSAAGTAGNSAGGSDVASSSVDPNSSAASSASPSAVGNISFGPTSTGTRSPVANPTIPSSQNGGTTGGLNFDNVVTEPSNGTGTGNTTSPTWVETGAGSTGGSTGGTGTGNTTSPTTATGGSTGGTTGGTGTGNTTSPTSATGGSTGGSTGGTGTGNTTNPTQGGEDEDEGEDEGGSEDSEDSWGED